MNKFWSIMLIVAVVALAGASVGLVWTTVHYNHARAQDEVCWTATAIVDSPAGFSAIGDVEVCGINLHFNGITGPTTHAPRPNSI